MKGGVSKRREKREGEGLREEERRGTNSEETRDRENERRRR